MAIYCGPNPKRKLLKAKDPYRSLPEKEYQEIEDEEVPFQSQAKKAFGFLYFAFCMFSTYVHHPAAYQIDFSIISNEEY